MSIKKKGENNMQRIIIFVGKNKTNVDICYGKDIKNILSLPIEFEKDYEQEGKLLKNDIQELIKRVKILNVVYYDIHIFGTSFFNKLEEKELDEFISNFEKETKRKILILTDEEEREIEKNGLGILVNK